MRCHSDESPASCFFRALNRLQGVLRISCDGASPDQVPVFYPGANPVFAVSVLLCAGRGRRGAARSGGPAPSAATTKGRAATATGAASAATSAQGFRRTVLSDARACAHRARCGLLADPRGTAGWCHPVPPRSAGGTDQAHRGAVHGYQPDQSPAGRNHPPVRRGRLHRRPSLPEQHAFCRATAGYPGRRRLCRNDRAGRPKPAAVATHGIPRHAGRAAEPA